MNKLWALSLTLVVAAVEGQGYGNYGRDYDEREPEPSKDYHKDYRDFYAAPQYAFKYDIHDPQTGDLKVQEETREGDVVKGFYMVKEADGTTREVHYTADAKNGFNAVVKRTGTPVHKPVHHQAPHYNSYYER